MERPALKRLIADIEAGRIDVVVVYKVDRLTRALSDFARLVDVFDRRGVSSLAFLSPRIVAAIANGDVPAGVTVCRLVRSLPFNWTEQEQRFGLR